MLENSINSIIYKFLAYIFYERVEKIQPPAEMCMNFNALGLPDDCKVTLKLPPLDRGFSREFSLYGFREPLNSFFVYWVVRKYKPIVIDIGANIGYYVGVAKVAGARKIIAVEPSLPAYRYLRKNFSNLPNIIFINVAVSNSDEEVYFQVSSKLNLSSVVDNQYKESVIRVKAYSLKTLVRMLNLKGCQNLMLRMDVEGYERKILEDIPSEVKWINVELHPSKYNIDKFLKQVMEQGFTIKYFISDVPFGFYPIIASVGLTDAVKILNRLFKNLIFVYENVHLGEIRSLLRRSVHPYIIFLRT